MAGAFAKGSSEQLHVHAVLLPDFRGDFALLFAEGQDPVQGTENHREGAQCQNYICHRRKLHVCGWCGSTNARTVRELMVRRNNHSRGKWRLRSADIESARDPATVKDS